MNSKSIYISYFNYVIEFSIPQSGQRWEREASLVFRHYYSGYLIPKNILKTIDMQIQFSSNKDIPPLFLRANIMNYLVPIKDNSLDLKKFGQLLKEIIITTMLLLTKKSGGVCLHASSVRFNGKAILFIGDKGAGKSTICQLLSPQFTQLTDDATFLIYQKNWITSPLPIFEKEVPLEQRSSQEQHEVIALCLINQSQHNVIIKLQKTTKVFQQIIDNIIVTGTSYEYASLRTLWNSYIPIYKIEFEKKRIISKLLMEKWE